MSTWWQHFLTPLSGSLGNQSPRESRVPGFLIRVQCTTVLVSWLPPYPAPPTPTREISSLPQPALLRVLWYLGGVTQEGGWRWEPHPWDLETRWHWELFQPRGSTILGCTRLGWTLGGPAWIWKLGSHPQGTRHSGSRRGSFAGTSSPAPSAPPQSSLGSQGCSAFRGVTAAQVPRPEGNTVDISVVFFLNFIVYWSRDTLHSGVCYWC